MTHRPLSAPRRALALTAAALLSGALLAGCADDTADDAAGTTAATSSAAPDPSTSAPAGSAVTTQDADGQTATLSYPGEDGRTALELLLAADPTAESTGEGANAYVTTVGGRAADDSAKEFWALYVDGEQAQVGAGTLETKDGEQIEWKLETY
ncbi:DUF4430 domain-containing protein [Cellulomonas sp. PhB143]|uniref:DUF4430 domain-containing protein n=1 Tax=Cellulomonas sp. PhB143 TaxID=2485186 RepID=UPI000F49ACA6|nr:DUF4430 domain-containing protein [Cellulomonas sp. PhB143]ROS72998.1 uncharacterized protein DUF4430 [Cellulomonas sp. PhB143]